MYWWAVWCPLGFVVASVVSPLTLVVSNVLCYVSLVVYGEWPLTLALHREKKKHINKKIYKKNKKLDIYDAHWLPPHTSQG